jgi:tetratricopeptide (TPR) repeat protein
VREPRVIAGRFELVAVAGAGGSASVHRAVDRRTGDLVAVKVLKGEPDREAIERFDLEAGFLAGLSHPGIVRYVDHGRTGGDTYLAMEWLDGITLTQRLTKNKSLAVDDAAALVLRVSDALGAAHAKGIVHRDVKPANIFLVEGDTSRVKLLDFGIARLRSRLTELTQAGIVVGTPGYMAPEQARADKSLDARADVFALGCVFFRCLTGRNAFAGSDLVAVLAKILLEEAAPIRSLRPDAPAAIEELVARMLSKRRDDRPSDANAVGAALSALAVARDPAPPPAPEHGALSTEERRMMCVLLATAPPSGWSPDDAHGRYRAMRAALAARGGHLEVLADRSLLVTVEGVAAPTDDAARAARCALAMRALLPELPIALAAGVGEVRGGVAIGPVIDRGAALLGGAAGARGGVYIDAAIAGLLDRRFEVREERGALLLVDERDAAAARTFLGRPSRCVGRERDLAVLDGIWRECVEESVARIVLVTGPAGIGKSRVLEELVARVRASDRRVEIWTGRGDPMTSRSPFAMIADPIRQAASIKRDEPAAERRLKLYTRVFRCVPPEDVSRVAVFLGEIIGAPFRDDESVELHAAREDPQLLGDQTRRAWEDWLGAEASKAPVLLVLDDLHWGDLPSVQFVDAAARHLAGRPLLVLALARPEVYAAFPNIWNERSLTELRLGRLTDKAAARLVRDALGDEVPELDVQHIAHRADGNAFFLEELVRAHADGHGDALPTTVLAMVQARLAALSPEARRFLRAASVFGRVFTSRGVAALIGHDDAPTLPHEWLAELVEKDVVVRPAEPQFQGELAFQHALIHEAAYAMLTEADRTLGHRLAAEWLERRGEADALLLAEHFERGGELLRAVAWFRRAADQALRADDHLGAIERAERAIACGARGEDLGALWLIEAEARRWRGENELAKDAATRAMQSLAPGTAGFCDAASELAAVYGSLGDTEHLVALARELADTTPIDAAPTSRAATSGHSQLVNALARLARPLFWAGKHALASLVLSRAAVLADRASAVQPTAMAALYMARGVEARLLGDPSECVRCNELAVAQSESAGDLRGGCVERGNLGYAYLEIGAYAEAERALTDALATATRLGLPLVAATARQNLGLAIGRRGAFDDAIALERASLAAFEAQGDARRAGCSLLYLACVEAESGALDAAEASARRAVEVLVHVEPVRCNALAVLAQAELARGDVEAGAATAADAYALFTRLGGIDEGESRVRLVHAEALQATGDVDGARAAAAEALERLLARAEKIHDVGQRAAFLAAIPENARTLEIAAMWGVS